MTDGSSHLLGAAASPLTSPRESAMGGTESEASRRAWQREMERAQGENWFKAETRARGPLAEQAGMASNQPRPQTPLFAPVKPLASVRTTAAPTVLSPCPYGLLLAATSTASIPAERTGRERMLASAPSSITTTAATPAVSRGNLPKASIQAPVGTSMASAPVQTRTTLHLTDDLDRALRVHIQWDGDEAKVWVGIDACAANDLPGVVAWLSRWLSGQGLRVTSLVCNGQAWLGTSYDTAKDFFEHATVIGQGPSAMPDADAPIRFTATRDH